MTKTLSKTERIAPVHAASVADLLVKNGWFLATAESCTGGMIAAACTDLAGSSSWFERGFVTYSNAAKTELLGVDAAWIEQHGAVSETVARAMALGAIAYSKAQVSVAVTGVAGPGGGSADKPVGTVWFGWSACWLCLSIPKVNLESFLGLALKAQAQSRATLSALVDLKSPDRLRS